MKTLNPDEIFKPILTKIKNNEVKTTHQLRIILDGLADEYHVTPLNLLVTFREWLMKQNIELFTTDGVVKINSMTGK